MRRVRGRSALLFSMSLGLAATTLAVPPEVWVVKQGTFEIDVISTTSNAVVATIDISDPDADAIFETPYSIAFSTSPAHPGTHAFVTQDERVTVLEVAGRRVLHARDIAADTGVSGLLLRGVAAAAPREFLFTAGPVALRSYLHVAANSSLDGRFVVLDQDLLIANTANPVVASGLLVAGATAVDVHVMGSPAGPEFQRAWYSLGQAGGISTDAIWARVAGPRTLGLPWTVVDTRRFSLGTGVTPPDALLIGGAFDREQPVVPGSVTGILENLDTGGSCTVGGHIAAVSVTGPGADSYTVIALDRASSRMLVVDPITCAVTSRATGLEPVDLVTLGQDVWQAAFTADRGGDSVTRLDRIGGATTPIPLSLGSNPVSVGVPLLSQCTAKDLLLAKVDTDGDTFLDDIALTWTGVGSCPTYEVQCQCMDDEPDCPCPCSCDPPEAGCVCGGIDDIAPVAKSFGGGILIKPPWDDDPVPISSPWKMLGDSITPDFPHDDQMPSAASWAYSVVAKDP